MELFELIIILFALFAMSRTIWQFRQRVINTMQYAVWQGFWIVVIVFTLFPNAFGFLPELVGIGRLVDLVIYVSLALLFYLTYRTYVQLEVFRTELTGLSRYIALNDGTKKNKRSKK